MIPQPPKVVLNDEIANLDSATHQRLRRAASPRTVEAKKPSPTIPPSLTRTRRTTQTKHTVSPELKGYQNYLFQLKSQTLPLHKLLSSAPKVVFTRDWQLAREESKQLRVLSRIDELKAANMWSLRQLRPAPTPRPGVSQWDLLMEEMKWMSEDFREERRWKVGMAYTMAKWVMDWHNAPDKSVLCVDRKKARLKAASKNITANEPVINVLPTDDVVMSEAVESTTEITDTASPILNITSSTTPAEPSDAMVVDPPSTDTLTVPVVQQITSTAQPSASISTPIVQSQIQLLYQPLQL
ncbi:hypothetical protein BCR33DRAFT_77771 [Rhizoclosmatium globosum]|uniref:HSA domain-containing protein n=1 Tax=Rhizoclosmatium globosum TaxID=329046 RepID=A0A1Y2CL41_9FUNG|nr:hypothetical protein BCR33DRAFT_77771 [Rhizoclosmatium globosum]|eukprot:ORY47738.1 hypothetical protein BCR33DRAFT_77771 [Rhizoclosmatium globosum]